MKKLPNDRMDHPDGADSTKNARLICRLLINVFSFPSDGRIASSSIFDLYPELTEEVRIGRSFDKT